MSIPFALRSGRTLTQKRFVNITAPMKSSASLLLLLLAQLLFTSGCVTGRREIPLDVPQASSYPTSKGSIQIGFIEDLRVFEQDPDEPSTPSIKGKVTTMPDSLKVRMIGRQRNGYGMAMGDIALPENSSILAVSRKLLEESFTRMGYAKAQSSQPNYTVDVKINEFWAWFSPGFVSVSFEARILSLIHI